MEKYRMQDKNDQEMEGRKLLSDLFPGGVVGAYLEDNFPFLFINERMLQYLGYDSEQEFVEQVQGFVGNAIFEEDRAMVEDETREQLERLGEYHIEYRMIKKDGSLIWVRDIGRKGTDADGREIVNCIYFDITQEHEKQEELQRRYEEQVAYSRMLSTTSLASSMVNLTKNCITLQDTEHEGIMTVITQETPQQGFESMYPHIPDEDIRRKYASVFNTEIIKKDFNNGITSKKVVHPYDSFDYWMESKYNAVINPRNGDLEVYCFARDVTNEVRQEDVARTLMNHEYEEVVIINAETGEPLSLVDTGKSLIFNEQKLAGDYNVGLDHYFMKYCADEDPKSVAEALSLKRVNEQLQKQDIYTVFYSRFDSEGQIARKRASYAYLNKYHNSILCTVQDNTQEFKNETEQRKKLQSALEAAQRATKAKSDFLARMSHDLRTPMNAILGLAALTMDDAADAEKVRENMTKMRQASDFMIGLVNDILDLVKVEEGSVSLNMEPYSYKEFLLNMKTMFQPQCDAKGIQIQFAEAQLNPVGLTDKMRINQIFFNIFSNAVKYTPTGGSISCCVQNMRKEGKRIFGDYVIKDTGIGMSEEFQKHLFEPFVQEDSKVTPELQGSGLGLSITKHLVELMGGELMIHSKKGEGTTVIVRMSFELISENAREQIKAGEQKQDEQFLLGKKVLLVEDHPLNAQIARNLLEKKKMIVVYAENGQAAVDKFSASEVGTFDAVLMDIRMPQMNGLDAARTIRGLARPDALRVPIIAMTANAYDEDIREALASGMNEHLTKPIEPEVLYRTLEKYLKLPKNPKSCIM